MQLLLDNKKNDPTKWRVLSDLFAGRTKRPQQRTLDMFADLLAQRGGSSMTEAVRNIPDGPLWTTSMAAWNAGVVAAGAHPYTSLEAEAVHLERLAEATRAAAQQDGLRAALDHIQQWDMNWLPCQKWILPHIDCGSSWEQFAVTAAPLCIVSTLYLLACFEADFYEGNEEPRISKVLPEHRQDKLIRPMRAWLESIKASSSRRTVRELSDYMLSPRTHDEDAETLRRLVRKWWQKGEIPSWSRSDHIVDSLVQAHGESKREDIRNKVQIGLAVVRILDGLLNISMMISDRHPSGYDPISPFQDYPLMHGYALKLRTTLLLGAEQQCH